MRPPQLVRRLATALALAATALSVPAPSTAAAGDGTLALTVVDDRGTPMPAQVYRVDTTGAGVQLGDIAPTYAAPTPEGTYGLVVVGGWGGITCVQLAPCSWLAIQGQHMPAGPAAGAPVITEGKTTTVTATVVTPKLSGAGAIGSPLSIIVPTGLTDLANSLAALSLPGSVAPAVTWLRNGVQIDGASGLAYTPTAADAGSTISAVVAFPTVVSGYWAGLPSLVPGPLTTSGIAVPTPAPMPGTPTLTTPKVSLSLPTKFKQGKRPKAYVTVKDGARAVPGVVRLQVGKRRAQQATLRAGLATFTLPKLAKGRFVVRVTYTGTTDYRSVTATKKILVKAPKHRR